MKTLLILLLTIGTAYSDTQIIWNPDGTTTTIIDNGVNGSVWGGPNGGLQGSFTDNGTSTQYWENGGGVTTIPDKPHSRWELPPIDPIIPPRD